MIIDLEQIVKVYHSETGLHTVTLIDFKNKTVCTEDSLCFNWNDITFVHEIP